MTGEVEFTYRYVDSAAAHTAAYLWEPVVAMLRSRNARRVLDVGCGNGSFAAHLDSCGFEVLGCDPSEDGVRVARLAHPKLNFLRWGVYDDPGALGEGKFDAVVAIEVIEHLLYPRYLPRISAKVLAESGTLVLTTPYHGYLKNLLLSLTNRWDTHWSPWWDGGHVKFWSRASLGRVLGEEGFAVEQFAGAGRIPWLWKSMIVAARRR